jgi:trigger factor
MSAKVTKNPNGEIEITITFPWSEVSIALEKQIQAAVDTAEISGFRKGKAPRNMVEPQLDKNKLYSSVIQKILPSAYESAIKDNQLKPILYPHIHIQKAEPEKDWEFSLHTCEAPVINLEKYESIVALVSKDPADSRVVRILDELRKLTKLTLPDILVEEEANHRLGALIENITQLGMTTNSYLEAKKLTPETLKAQMANEARADLEAEFILSHIQSNQKLADRKKTLDYLLSLV